MDLYLSLMYGLIKRYANGLIKRYAATTDKAMLCVSALVISLYSLLYYIFHFLCPFKIQVPDL